MVYIHIPFCKSFCTYCDFYSEICSARESAGVQDLFVARLCSEMDERKDEILAASVPATLYIGGGTPSVLDPVLLRKAVDHLRDVTGVSVFDEFTVEVNPEDIVSKLSLAEDYVRMGVNRISMGVQSFDDGILKWMNRRHDAAHAVKAFETLRHAGFDNISIDLIFGLSQMDDMMWQDTLTRALTLHPQHISAYQLSIEEGSALGRLVRDGKYEEASEDRCRRQYEILCRRLAEAGYRHYEVSNFALPGFEAMHNGAYWKRCPYVGLGPGAHSFDGKSRRWNSEDVRDWTQESETLSEEDVRVESIMLGLRTAEGLSLSDAGRLCDSRLLARLEAEGSLMRVNDRIRIPESSFFVSDDIIRRLI